MCWKQIQTIPGKPVDLLIFFSQTWAQGFGGCSQVFHGRFTFFSPSFHGLFTLQTCLDSVKSPDDTHPDIVRNPGMLIILDRYMGVKQIATHGRALAPMHF